MSISIITQLISNAPAVFPFRVQTPASNQDDDFLFRLHRCWDMKGFFDHEIGQLMSSLPSVFPKILVSVVEGKDIEEPDLTAAWERRDPPSSVVDSCTSESQQWLILWIAMRILRREHVLSV